MLEERMRGMNILSTLLGWLPMIVPVGILVAIFGSSSHLGKALP
jgi:hypothetical protein